MKTNILNNSEEIVKGINELLEANTYTVEGLYTVPYGKGVRKDQLMLTVTKQGEYTANITFDTVTMKYIKCIPIRKI